MKVSRTSIYTLLAIAIFIVLVSAGTLLSPVGSSANVDEFVVKNGDAEEVVDELKERGYISNGITATIAFKMIPEEVSPGVYFLSPRMSLLEVFSALESPDEQVVVIPKGVSRGEVARALGDVLNWNDPKKESFKITLTQIQWQKMKGLLISYFEEEYGWSKTEIRVFEDNISDYKDENEDVLSGSYKSGEYSFAQSQPVSNVATELVDSVLESEEEQVYEKFNDNKIEDIALSIKSEVEYLPDIVPLPPGDLSIQRQNGRDLLVFSTTYYNQGDGPLELVADPEAVNSEGDVEADVYQHVRRHDDSVREEVVGTFQWHQEHLHYHFSDFVDYELVSEDDSFTSEEIKRAQKATFCVRDVSEVDIKNQHKAGDAEFKICHKDRQGVSVGWGDTYFHDYPDQNVDITGLPSGIYRLSFIANPERRFDEEKFDNNISSALLDIDTEAGTVEVLEKEPEETPHIEHVYPDQPFGIN